MNDNPYPNASDTMHYELHTAWDEGYAEGFAAGRAAADEPWREAIAFINWFAEGPCGCDGDPQDPCDSCRALALLTRLDDLAGRAAASPDQPDDWTAAILTLRRAMCTPAGREQVERELIRPFAASPDERLREALELIRAHARLDLTERGIAEAERYAAIADDALTARDQETER